MTYTKWLAVMCFVGISTSQLLAAQRAAAEPEQKTYLMMCMAEAAGQSWGQGVLYSVFRTKSTPEEVKISFRKLAQKQITDIVFEPYCSYQTSEEGAEKFFTDRGIRKLKEVQWVESGHADAVPKMKLSKTSRIKPEVSASQELSQTDKTNVANERLRAAEALAAERRRIKELNDAARQRSAAEEAAYRQRMLEYNAELEAHRTHVAAADAAKLAFEAELARTNAAKEQYNKDIAAYEAQVKALRSQNEKDALVDWPEAVTVCELDPRNPQSKFGNWKCVGPLQFDYANLGASGNVVTDDTLFHISNTCGGKSQSVRDLGMLNGYRVFGCSFGMHPDSGQRTSLDAASKFGIGYIPGRETYKCPKLQSFCRVH